MSESACGKASSDSTDSGKDFSCDWCETSFSSQRSKERHERNKHPSCLPHGCPRCDGKFHTKRGVKYHYGRVHEGSLANFVECDWCGDEFKRKPSVSEENENDFCGDECRGKWISENNTGQNNPNWAGKTTTECKKCGEIFEHKPYVDRTYCGKECRDGYKHNSESNFWRGGKVELECVECGEKFKVHESEKGERKRCSMSCLRSQVTKKCENCGEDFDVSANRSDTARFCSRDCFGEFRSKLPPEKQPAYNGGHAEYYGPNWKEQRKKALERDNYTCQYCGKNMSENERNPDVHHIKRLKWYQDNYDAPKWWKKANRLENLVALCRPCHQKWEGIPLRPQWLG